MLKPTIKRSACDQCRAKRVRCLRPQESMAPCARCRYTGARCLTSAAGHPGRPPKQRLAVPSPAHHDTSMGHADNVHVHESSVAVVPPSAGAMHASSPRDVVTHEPQQDIWLASGDTSASLDFTSAAIEEIPSQDQDVFPLPDQLDSLSQLQGFLSADDEFNAILLMGGDPNPTLSMEIEPLLSQGEDLPSPAPIQCLSTKNSLMRFRDKIDQRIATVDMYYSDIARVSERCKDSGAGQDVENPAALLLTCTKELTDIIQSLDQAARLDTLTHDTLSTETVLLILSSYLALMRLFDGVFYRICNYLCEVPPESWESIKVKSVLRIGGISSLQDMPLKLYAIGILDAIKAQVQALEHYMGIPAEYCLSGEATTSPVSTASGIFSNSSRKRLFWAVMAQEDVRSLRGSRSYVESIRASIKDSMRFLND